MVLCIAQLTIEIWYSSLSIVDREYKWSILAIKMIADKYDHDITNVIKLYLPAFYDSNYKAIDIELQTYLV